MERIFDGNYSDVRRGEWNGQMVRSKTGECIRQLTICQVAVKIIRSLKLSAEAMDRVSQQYLPQT